MKNPDLIINEKEYFKANDLNSLNFHKGQLYETIVTSQNKELEKNAAAIGVVCKDSSHIVIYLNNCKNTQRNILENGEFIVNICKDPLIFTYSTIGKLEDEYFSKYNEFPIIKDNLGFFKGHVIKVNETKRENDFNNGIGHVVTAEVNDIYFRKPESIEPINRAQNAVIESLIYYCRFDGKYKKKQKEIWEHILELNRLSQRVGNESEKKSMKIILDKMRERFDLE
ncbi:DUF447 domain-containing protein [uncultured Methanobrevibacter sp.]|uniref:DUF447 domain-containing protein n=1 Tax=uncultured Methanobrevibacter sp. TaxID=253161 RepID=UPI00262518AA